MMVTHGGYELDDDPARVDRQVVWRFLSEQAYWARWRERADVDRQITGAWRVVGAYAGAGPVGVVGAEPTGTGMVGFAWAVSDGVSFAYLADVFVAPSARGLGLGVEMVRLMIDARRRTAVERHPVAVGVVSDSPEVPFDRPAGLARRRA